MTVCVLSLVLCNDACYAGFFSWQFLCWICVWLDRPENLVWWAAWKRRMSDQKIDGDISYLPSSVIPAVRPPVPVDISSAWLYPHCTLYFADLSSQVYVSKLRPWSHRSQPLISAAQNMSLQFNVLYVELICIISLVSSLSFACRTSVLVLPAFLSFPFSTCLCWLSEYSYTDTSHLTTTSFNNRSHWRPLSRLANYDH